jgi:hypothetical protein
MSKQAIDSERAREGLKDVLLGLAQLHQSPAKVEKRIPKTFQNLRAEIRASVTLPSRRWIAG